MKCVLFRKFSEYISFVLCPLMYIYENQYETKHSDNLCILFWEPFPNPSSMPSPQDKMKHHPLPSGNDWVKFSLCKIFY